MKPNKEGFDYGIFIAVLILVLGGVALVGSSSAATALEGKHNWAYYMTRQIVWAIAGIFGAIYFFRLSDEKLRKQVPFLIYGSIFLLFLTLVPKIGINVNNASRWIGVKHTLFVIQPYEFVKMAYVIFLADLFGNTEIKMKDKIIKSFIITIVICGILAKQPDLGGAIIICSIYVITLLIAGISFLWLIPVGTVAIIALTLYIRMSKNKSERMQAWLDPWKDAANTGYHTIQSMIAVGSGGLFGTGFSQGKQKNLFLDMPHTDYIFSTIAEELGFVGAFTVIGIFIFFMWKGVLVAMHIKEKKQKYLAALITFLIMSQVFINIGVATGLLPAKGTTLPFISAGGSALVVNIMCVGLLLALSKKAVGKAE